MGGVNRSVVVDIDGSEMTTWDAFHDEFARAFGFPDFYGRNGNAWIDCFRYPDEDDGMRRVSVQPGQLLVIRVVNSSVFRKRNADAWLSLHEWVSFLASDRLENGLDPVVAVASQE